MDTAALRLVVVVVVLVTSGACVSAETTPDRIPKSALLTPSASTFTGTQDVLVSRPSTRGPERCHPEDVGRLVVAFLAAVNRGDAEQAVKFFTDDLGWYSVTEGNPSKGGRHFVAYAPAKLRTYFKDRVQNHERMYLLEIDVEYDRSDPHVGNVAYGLIRSADDLEQYAEKGAAGKGAIDCRTGRISVWSMAHRKRPVPGGLCPGQPDPPHIAIACARAEPSL